MAAARPCEMRKLFFAVLVGGGFLFANQGFAAPSIAELFGSRVTGIARFSSPYARLDFVGDGVADPVYLVSIAHGSSKLTISSDVTVVPDVFGVPPGHPLANNSERIALGVVLGRSGRKFLITDFDNSAHFFDSPIWQEKSIPISVATRGSPAQKAFQKQAKSIENDILVLGTEAGIDIALYWNGKNFAVFWPNEEP